MSNQAFLHDNQMRHARHGSPGYDTTDVEWARKEVGPPQEAEFLQVIDVPFDGSGTRSSWRFGAVSDIAERLEQIAPHRQNTARILDVTVHSDFKVTGLRDEEGPERTQAARNGLIQYLEDSYKPQTFNKRRIFRHLNDPILVNDIGSISSQWSQSLSGKDKPFYRLVNRSSLQQYPLDLDLRPRDSYMTCAKDEVDRLLVIIVHDVGENQKFSINKEGSGTPFSNPRIVSGILHDRSWTTFSDGTLETFTKLLLLDFFEASIYLQPVDYYEGLIYANLGEKEGLKVSLAKNPHLQVPLGLFEPRLSAKSRDAFKEIEDAEGILRSVNNLVDSIKCVITALESVDRHEMQSAPNKDYDERMEMLEGLCAERRKNAERALNALARQLDYLTKKHAISEAKAIRILTILASFYLPLSLSGTLLGMSTPFKRVAHNRALSDSDSDLIDTNLLFDFFGCFVVLATGTIIIVHIIRFILWLKAHGVDTLSRQLDILPRHLSGTFTLLNYGKLWRFGGRGGDFFQLVRVSSRWFVGLGLGITLLIIFMIGMLKNSEEAWFYARWVFAAYITTSGLLLILFLLLYIWLYCKSFKRGWMFRVLKAIHLV